MMRILLNLLMKKLLNSNVMAMIKLKDALTIKLVSAEEPAICCRTERAKEKYHEKKEKKRIMVTTKPRLVSRTPVVTMFNRYTNTNFILDSDLDFEE